MIVRGRAPGRQCFIVHAECLETAMLELKLEAGRIAADYSRSRLPRHQIRVLLNRHDERLRVDHCAFGGASSVLPLYIHSNTMYACDMIEKELVAASTEPLILSLLARGESYGYELIQEIKELSEDKIKWTDGMLYPVLHRMEDNGW